MHVRNVRLESGDHLLDSAIRGEAIETASRRLGLGNQALFDSATGNHVELDLDAICSQQVDRIEDYSFLSAAHTSLLVVDLQYSHGERSET
jgi:hypothetical protein